MPRASGRSIRRTRTCTSPCAASRSKPSLPRHRRRLSINLLFERLRWYTEIETQGDPFKVNNTFRAWYARLLMRQEPALAGVFETRRSDADEAL